uniref:hAT-like transposase RNase-H fold domain-containing protein n=1 Tax=Solanum lycopersicum TaxID=4081 RepID=A0A3Q7IYD8_SOLLC
MHMLLLVAVALNPRFKIKYVIFFKNYYNSLEGYSKSYRVIDTLINLYNHYKNSIDGTLVKLLEIKLIRAGVCIFDCYRSSLPPKTVEALVCTQQ